MLRGNMLSWVGFAMGSAVQSVSDYFVDEAFTSSAQVRRTRPLTTHLISAAQMLATRP